MASSGHGPSKISTDLRCEQSRTYQNSVSVCDSGSISLPLSCALYSENDASDCSGVDDADFDAIAGKVIRRVRNELTCDHTVGSTGQPQRRDEMNGGYVAENKNYKSLETKQLSEVPGHLKNHYCPVCSKLMVCFSSLIKKNRSPCLTI